MASKHLTLQLDLAVNFVQRIKTMNTVNNWLQRFINMSKTHRFIFSIQCQYNYVQRMLLNMKIKDVKDRYLFHKAGYYNNQGVKNDLKLEFPSYTVRCIVGPQWISRVSMEYFKFSKYPVTSVSHHLETTSSMLVCVTFISVMSYLCEIEFSVGAVIKRKPKSTCNMELGWACSLQSNSKAWRVAQYQTYTSLFLWLFENEIKVFLFHFMCIIFFQMATNLLDPNTY